MISFIYNHACSAVASRQTATASGRVLHVCVFAAAFSLILSGIPAVAAQTGGGIAPFAVSSAQEGADPVRELSRKIASSEVSFDYTYVMESARLNAKGSGKALMQGGSYFLEGDGLRVWCDGESVWTMDVDANEVVIEPSDAANGLTANPVLMLTDLDGLYTWDRNGQSDTFAGSRCRSFSLSPKAGAETEFSGVKLYLAGDRLVGAVLEMDSASMTFTISSLGFRRPDLDAVFVPGTFPDDCIVTDLR